MPLFYPLIPIPLFVFGLPTTGNTHNWRLLPGKNP